MQMRPFFDRSLPAIMLRRPLLVLSILESYELYIRVKLSRQVFFLIIIIIIALGIERNNGELADLIWNLRKYVKTRFDSFSIPGNGTEDPTLSALQ